MLRVAITIARQVTITVTARRRPEENLHHVQTVCSARPMAPSSTVLLREQQVQRRLGVAIPAIDNISTAMVTASDASSITIHDQHSPCRNHCALGAIFHLYADCGLGRGRSRMVRRRASHSPFRNCCPRDRRHLPSQPALSRRLCHRGARRIGPYAGPRNRSPHGRAHKGFWPSLEVHFGRQRWWN